MRASDDSSTELTKEDRPCVGDDRSGLDWGLGFALGRTHRVVRSAWEARIRDLSLTGPQASVLRAVVESSGCGLRELARRLQTDAMNVKRLVDGLERAGHLVSAADPLDRRRRVLRPTSAGLAVGDELVGRATEWNRQLDGLLDPGDPARLRGLLARIESGVTTLGLDVPPTGAPGGSGRPRHRGRTGGNGGRGS